MATNVLLMARLTFVSPQKKGCEYKFHTEFQSHEPEFDYLKSLEIEEKINKIKWCKRQNSAHFLLSTNGIVLGRAIEIWMHGLIYSSVGSRHTYAHWYWTRCSWDHRQDCEAVEGV